MACRCPQWWLALTCSDFFEPIILGLSLDSNPRNVGTLTYERRLKRGLSAVARMTRLIHLLGRLGASAGRFRAQM